MKLVLFSDLHLDSAFAWLGGVRGAGDRWRRALRETLERIAQLAIEEQADALLCGGDLYEQDRFTPDTAAFLRRTFEQLSPLPVFIAPGNHDWYGPASLYARVQWSPNVRVFESNRLEPVSLTDGLTLWGAAHHAPAGTPGFLDGFSVDRGGVNLALFHGSAQVWIADEGSGKVAHAPFDVEQIEQAGLDFVMLGHYHRARRGSRHVYPGNPVPLSFGEDGERGAVVLEVEPDGAVRMTWRRVASCEVHDLTVDLTGCTSQHEARERVGAALAGKRGVARVTLTGEIDPGINLRLAELDDIPSDLDGYQVRLGALTTAYPIEQIAEEPTVRGQFVRNVLAATDLSEDERRRVLVTGLRALDGRDDLEVL